MTEVNNFNKIIKFISRYLKILRFWETLNKVQVVIISIILYGIFVEIKPPSFYLQALVFMFSYITYCYVLNDYADFKHDIIKKKHLISKGRIKFFAIAFAILNLFFYFYYIINNSELSIRNYSLATYIISIFLITFYSVPPIRFKERGILGIIIGSIMQRSLPFLVLVLTYAELYLHLILFIFIILLVHAMLAMIAHQVLEYKSDIKTKTKTWVISIGLEKTRRVFEILMIFFYILIFLISLTINFKIFVSSLIILLILIPEIEWIMSAYNTLNRE